jgi:ankyrin repeat protein
MSELFDLTGRVAIVTGASRGLGQYFGKALAKAGADMNALEYGIYDVVTIAAVADDPELMSLALAHGNRADLTTSIYDGTALIAAAHLGHVEVVRRLIKAGAPLDHINNLDWTALIEAVVLGDGGPDHIATVKALVEAGADISISDRNGVTPLAHAEGRGYKEIEDIIRNSQNWPEKINAMFDRRGILSELGATVVSLNIQRAFAKTRKMKLLLNTSLSGPVAFFLLAEDRGGVVT